ncbi:MAG: ZIP family metal transporter [Acidobacteria bacterium]|nr:ZIP family metal transporter [Acidobacteriota bacterium]
MQQLDLLALSVLAAGGNLLGGALITRKQPVAHPSLHLLIAIGAGFLLAAVCLEIIPAAMPRGSGAVFQPMTMFVAGYLTLFTISNVLAQHSHAPSDAEPETHVHWQDRNFARRVTAALILHTFFDGVAIASGAAVSLELGVLLAVAALLHKIPEGITIASVLLTAGYSRRVAQGATVLIALATLLGASSVMVIQPPIYSLLPFTGGIAFYVAASDLIPEVRRKGGVSALLAVIAGAILFGAVHLLMHAARLH